MYLNKGRNKIICTLKDIISALNYYTGKRKINHSNLANYTSHSIEVHYNSYFRNEIMNFYVNFIKKKIVEEFPILINHNQ